MAAGADEDIGERPIEVILLAGRLGLDDDGWPLTPLVDRIESRGIAPRVLCSAQGKASDDPRIVEIPWLSRPWLKHLAVRRLRLDPTFKRPSILHAVHEEMSAVALDLAEIWRIPYIQTIDDFASLDEGLRLSRRWLRTVVASSAELAAALVAELHVPGERVVVIPPGITVENAPVRADGWKVPVIGVAGPPVEEAGFVSFLEAARIVLTRGRDAEFLIASQGGDAIELRRYAQTLGIQERVTVADFPVVGPRFWSVLDLYCQPSLVPSTGRTLTLALANGVPSVAADVQGLRGIIEAGRSGLLASPGDPAALADAFIHLLDHPDHARAMGAVARDQIRARFNLDDEADRLVALYRRSVDPPPIAGRIS
ncbi:glycosyltransferase family 4 protein [Paludisphaera borealis]|uniref:GT4 family glycosyltransferase n=1 Tax=Paludisphaera borealis TaxID=1387353 RepID=A0A1U7CKI3_9BACT|nr:glycosyltransferase family 4 protein [Paludisphaera borealis]APW59450.1 GT4 family glycosyltransferase [Paludisphaera borealis]